MKRSRKEEVVRSDFWHIFVVDNFPIASLFHHSGLTENQTQSVNDSKLIFLTSFYLVIRIWQDSTSVLAGSWVTYKEPVNVKVCAGEH